MRRERKHYTAEEKVAILRRHLLDKVPVSDLCEELGLRPTVFYRWQKEFFENGSAAFQSKERPARQVEEKQKRIEFLEKKVQTKDEVLAEVMAVSPASVWRVLKQAGLLSRWKSKPSRKGTGFEQPPQPHQHWHIDVSYINVSGTFYYLCSVLDGYSRFLVHWDLRESMKEADIEIIRERAKQNYPEAKPRIISDNGPQFIARDFKEFIRISGMTHVRISPFYPQSNGKLERWHKSLTSECIRPLTPLTLEDARRLIQSYVDHYNTVRLHSAIGYVTPQDMITGRQAEIHGARDRKLEQARRQRQLRRQQAPPSLFARFRSQGKMTSPGETEAGSAGKQPC